MDATFMTALNIVNVRHLKNITIPLSTTERRSIILTGKNGSGKTSVLESLENFLEFVVSSNFYTKDKCERRICELRQKTLSASSTEENKLNAQQNQPLLKTWEKSYNHWVNGAVAEFTSYADMRAKYQQGNFILAYYGDKRKISVQVSKNIEKVDLKDVYTIKDNPSQLLVKYLVNLKTTAAFAQSSGNLERVKEINEWFDRFEGIMRDLYEDDKLRLEFNIETFEFSILQQGRKPFDFNTMSMGYAAVFDIIGDLIMRMESKKNYNIEGLVLIDEIETHLHVELQKKIMPVLMKLFPNIQFVLTTHSPFILNSTPDSVVYDLETHTLAQDGLTNLPYDGIVEGYFNVDSLSQDLRKKFSEYKSIVGKLDLSDADYARASELEMYLDEVPDYLALDFAAEYERLKQELSNRG